ncbi:MAG: DUF692 domain-containing protein [Chitinophagales bacterium]|nr:DUF692 domain-containing protein [Chitinophagales bacterium]
MTTLKKIPCQQQNHCISFCTTYDAHDPLLLAGVMPFVDALEVTPDSIAIYKNGQTRLHPEIINSLEAAASQKSIVAHGVGLSIGSFEGYSEAYLELLEELMKLVPLKWHSEHLGYTTIDGMALNTMLAVPRTDEMLEILIQRIQSIMKRIELPFLLENIVHLIPDYEPSYSDAEFLNILVDETGCELILDLYNIECDAINYQFDIDHFLETLNLDAVKEIHLAGGVQHKGFQLDIHSGTVANSTLELANTVIPKCPNLEIITYEILPQAIARYGREMVIDELARLRTKLPINNESESLSTKH